KAPMPAATITSEPTRSHLRNAIAHLLLIEAGIERASSPIKVSVPMVRHAIAENLQRLNLKLVEFPAADYVAKVPPPTTQQLDEQFKKFANADAVLVDTKTNPHGFSYRFPDRVKLQYITVPR